MPQHASEGKSADGADSSMLRWLLFGAVVAVTSLIWGMHNTQTAICTDQEGLCSTTPCACNSPQQEIREMWTPKGTRCWQCVSMCPAADDAVDAPDAGTCHTGHCECANRTHERIRIRGPPEAPCWRCAAPQPVLHVRGVGEDKGSCLVKASRSKLPPPPRATAGGTSSSSNDTDNTVGMTTGAMEPALRLVLISSHESEQNRSCASFVWESETLRERNSSLCLSWSSLGEVWGLGKCAPAGSLEARAQAFSEEPQGEDDGSMFCSIGSQQDVGPLCVALHGRVCSADPTVCTPHDCECEDSTWQRHDKALTNDSLPCWTCARKEVPYCSTAPGVCTTMPCECENTEHEKVESNTTELPVRVCWACRSPRMTNQGGWNGGTVFAALVGIFLIGVGGGLAVKCWNEEPLQHVQAHKGKHGMKGSASMQPMPWSERLALELEELWIAVEEGFIFLFQVAGNVLKPVRRWRNSLAARFAPQIRAASHKCQKVARVARDCGTSTSRAVFEIKQHVERLFTESRTMEQEGEDAAPEEERAAEEEQPVAAEPSPDPQRRCCEAADEIRHVEETGAGTPTAAATASSTVAAEPQVVEDPAVKSSAEPKDARRRRRRRARSEAANEVTTVQQEEEDEVDEEGEEAEEVDPALSLVCSRKGWDPVKSGSAKSLVDLQHARLLLLLHQANRLAAINSSTLAAKWLLMFYTPADKVGAESLNLLSAGRAKAAVVLEADFTRSPESASSSLGKRRRSRKSRRNGQEGAEVSEIQAEDAMAAVPWNPLGKVSEDRPSQAELQHARFALLARGTGQSSLSGGVEEQRRLGAAWLATSGSPDLRANLKDGLNGARRHL
mmetsp:Transcript_29534/g.68110  ORF Transcript_29534/g.68110 Transcript_29534/m.68110 type:complete len:843 (-) Transcript_29534:159-2687(-)